MFTGGLCCKLYVGVERFTVGEELLGMFHLVDDKDVINVPKPDAGGIGGGAHGSGFEFLHEQVAYGRPHSSPMYLFIIVSLQCKKGSFR